MRDTIHGPRFMAVSYLFSALQTGCLYNIQEWVVRSLMFN